MFDLILTWLGYTVFFLFFLSVNILLLFYFGKYIFNSVKLQVETAVVEVRESLNGIIDLVPTKKPEPTGPKAAPVKPIVTPPRDNPPVRLQVQEKDVIYALEIAEDFSKMIDGELYVITKPTDFEDLLKTLPEKSVILPLIGKSCVGKTHTLARLLQKDPKKAPFKGLISNGTNNSLLPIIAKWKTVNDVAIYFIDLPGIGCYKQWKMENEKKQLEGQEMTCTAIFNNWRGILGDEEGGEFIKSSLKHLLEPIRSKIAVVLLVAKGKFYDDDATMISGLANSKLSVLVGHNVENGIIEFEDPRYQEDFACLSTRLSLHKLLEPTIISYCCFETNYKGKVLKSDFTIEHLEKTLENYIQIHGKEIAEQVKNPEKKVSSTLVGGVAGVGAVAACELVAQQAAVRYLNGVVRKSVLMPVLGVVCPVGVVTYAGTFLTAFTVVQAGYFIYNAVKPAVKPEEKRVK
jgi:hypothetical protein